MPLLGFAAHCFALSGAAAEIGAAADARWAAGNREAALSGQNKGLAARGQQKWVGSKESSEEGEEGTTCTGHSGASKNI